MTDVEDRARSRALVIHDATPHLPGCGGKISNAVEGWQPCSCYRHIRAMLAFATQERDAAGEGVSVPRNLLECAIDAYEGEWGSSNKPEHWTHAMKALLAAQSTPATDNAVLVEQAAKIPSPVTRLIKGYANQRTDGAHMVDLIDAANGYVICRCVYEPYADEILTALRAPPVGEG